MERRCDASIGQPRKALYQLFIRIKKIVTGGLNIVALRRWIKLKARRRFRKALGAPQSAKIHRPKIKKQPQRKSRKSRREASARNSVTRLTGSSKKAVSRLTVDARQAADWYQDRVFRNLTCKCVQVDEIWAFVYAKQKNVATAKKAPPDAGDVWTWTAIDADTKLMARRYD